MAIAIICPSRDTGPWVAAIKEIDPDLEVLVWPDDSPRENVTFALCWQQPQSVLSEYPNLRCLSSMGAGVDHLISDAALPPRLPIVRLVDPLLAQSMFEYVCAAVMYYFREFDGYQAQQRQRRWHQTASKPAVATTVGVMGLGQLGGFVAGRLSGLGFNVVGWSRSAKSIDGVETYAGEAQQGEFLSRAEILVCLLPLTPETAGILNRDLFGQLPQGACLVNVARGEHLVEGDLLAALGEGHLRGACLDVFQQEPLPQDHPFWVHEKIMVTPHCSSITEPRSVAPQVVENYRRSQQGQPLLNQVSTERGY